MAGLNVSFAGWSAILILAVLLALVATFAPTVTSPEMFFIIAALLGVGLVALNVVTSKESIKYIIFYIGVALAFGLFAQVPTIGTMLNTFFSQLFVVFGVAVIVIGVKGLINIARK